MFAARTSDSADAYDPAIVKRAKPAAVEIVALDETGATNRLGTGSLTSRRQSGD